MYDYTQVIRIEPNNVDAYLKRGLCHYFLEEYQKAIADYTEVIRLDPSDARVYYHRGYALEEVSEYEKAIVDYTKAASMEIGPYSSRVASEAKKSLEEKLK